MVAPTEVITKKDLLRARRQIIKQTGRKLPKARSLDTTRASVAAGLREVGIDVVGASEFADQIARSNLERIRTAKKEYQINLFAAAIMTGMIYGAQAERNRHRQGIA